MSNVHKSTPKFGKCLMTPMLASYSLNDNPLSLASGFSSTDTLALGTKTYRIRRNIPDYNYLIEFPSISATSNALIYTNFPSDSSLDAVLQSTPFTEMNSVLSGTAPSNLSIYYAYTSTLNRLYLYTYLTSGVSLTESFTTDGRYVSVPPAQISTWYTTTRKSTLLQIWFNNNGYVYGVYTVFTSAGYLYGLAILKWSLSTNNVVGLTWIKTYSSTSAWLTYPLSFSMRLTTQYICLTYEHGENSSTIHYRGLNVLDYTAMTSTWSVDLTSIYSANTDCFVSVNAPSGYVMVDGQYCGTKRYVLSSGTSLTISSQPSANVQSFTSSRICTVDNEIYSYTSGGTTASRGYWTLIPEIAGSVLANTGRDQYGNWVGGSVALSETALDGALPFAKHITGPTSPTGTVFGLTYGLRNYCDDISSSLIYSDNPAYITGASSLYYYLFALPEGAYYGLTTIDPSGGNTWAHPSLCRTIACPTSVSFTFGSSTDLLRSLLQSNIQYPDYTITPSTNKIDCYFEYVVPTGKELNRIYFDCWWVNPSETLVSDIVTFQLYNWGMTTWDTIPFYYSSSRVYGKLTSHENIIYEQFYPAHISDESCTSITPCIDSTTYGNETHLCAINVDEKYVSSLNKVRIRFYATDLTEGTYLGFQQLVFDTYVPFWDIDIGEVHHIIDKYKTIVTGNL